MKMLKVSGLSVVFALALISCNQGEVEPETIDVQDTQEQTYDTDQNEQTNEGEDEGNSIGIDVEADEDGNVKGEVDGNIEFEDRK